jgi:hypothetical protein
MDMLEIDTAHEPGEQEQRIAGIGPGGGAGTGFDCTPTSITMPEPACSISAARRAGRMRVLISSKAVDVNVDVGAEHAAIRAIIDETAVRRQRVRRHERTQQLDDIAVVVIVRRLHPHEAKPPPRFESSCPQCLRTQHTSPQVTAAGFYR